MALGAGSVIAQSAGKTKEIEIDYLDTLNISIDSSCFITISALNLQRLKKEQEPFNTLINSFQKNLPSIAENIPKYDRYEIIYEDGKSVVVKEKKPDNTYTITSAGVKRNKDYSTCIITGKNFNMLIEFTTLQDLLRIDLKNKTSIAFKEIPEKEKNSKTWQMEIEGNSIKGKDYYNVNENRMWTFSFLNINPCAGIIKNQVYVDADFGMKIGISTKGFNRHLFLINYTYLPIFKDDFSIESYGFANIAYRLNTSWKRDDPNWVGFEYGYLVKRGGEFLEKNTQNIGVSVQLGKYLTVTSQWYFPGSIKNSYPGFKLDLDF